jgi:hypothetical protein
MATFANQSFASTQAVNEAPQFHLWDVQARSQSRNSHPAGCVGIGSGSNRGSAPHLVGEGAFGGTRVVSLTFCSVRVSLGAWSPRTGTCVRRDALPRSTLGELDAAL